MPPVPLPMMGAMLGSLPCGRAKPGRSAKTIHPTVNAAATGRCPAQRWRQWRRCSRRCCLAGGLRSGSRTSPCRPGWSRRRLPAELCRGQTTANFASDGIGVALRVALDHAHDDGDDEATPGHHAADDRRRVVLLVRARGLSMIGRRARRGRLRRGLRGRRARVAGARRARARAPAPAAQGTTAGAPDARRSARSRAVPPPHGHGERLVGAPARVDRVRAGLDVRWLAQRVTPMRSSSMKTSRPEGASTVIARAWSGLR